MSEHDSRAPAESDPASRAARVFKLLADESRMRILYALSEHDELHVQRICTLLGQTQPAVSHHLAMMRGAGLVTMRREGKHNFYRIDPASLQRPIRIIERMIAERRGRRDGDATPSELA